jgi:predicted nucleic acid-binding Zn ribbon protein
VALITGKPARKIVWKVFIRIERIERKKNGIRAVALEGLEGLIKGLEQQESWQVQKQFRLVLLHWPKSVGFAIARITRPISIQRDTLYVATSTSAWAQTLSYERFNILRKLNRYQKPPLKGIRFSTAQWAQRAPLNPLNQSGNPTENLAARGKLAHHPSYIGDVPHLTSPAPEAAPTPAESFARWASAMQDMQRSQALCPRCHCHCPQGELDRWACCSLCATKQWS